MSQSNFYDVEDFHIKFGLPAPAEVRWQSKEWNSFRLKFMREEIDEYEEALKEKNFEKAFDALIDLVYVALGTAVAHGFPWQRGWDRVHMANMKKIRAHVASDSKRGTAYDVIKPVGWQPPDLKDLVSYK